MNVPSFVIWSIFYSLQYHKLAIHHLEGTVFPVVLDWPDIQERWFQHDCAPAHYANVARKLLSDTFGNRWIGRRGGLKWSQRFPHLTLCGFFLWGVIKKAVYSTKPRSLEELKERITNAFHLIAPELCHKVHHVFIDGEQSFEVHQSKWWTL